MNPKKRLAAMKYISYMYKVALKNQSCAYIQVGSSYVIITVAVIRQFGSKEMKKKSEYYLKF